MAFLFLLTGCGEVGLAPLPEKEKAVNISVKAYCVTQGRNFEDLFAYNKSAVFANDRLVEDFDRDGLSDEIEMKESNIAKYNISAVSADTNSDRYSDFFAYSIGYDNDNQQRLNACGSLTQDTDLDTLSDCEEESIGTDVTKADTDGDGIPDGIEFRNGLNPNDPFDAKSDFDGDGVSVKEEIKTNSPFRVTNNPYTELQKTHYEFEYYKNEENQDCYDININNIKVMQVTNGNRYHLMFIESQIVQNQEVVMHVRNVYITASRHIYGVNLEVDGVSEQDLVFTGQE